MLFNIVFGVLGAIMVGGLLGRPGGAAVGFALGCLTAMTFRLKRRMGDLERRLGAMDRPGAGAPEPDRDAPREDDPGQENDAEEAAHRPAAAAPVSRPAAEEAPRPAPPGARADGGHRQGGGPPRRPASTPTAAGPWFARVRAFFTEGNVVVRVGVIILFFGVAFLLKYAAERNAFPVEFRLAGVAAGAVALLTAGWRLRLKMPGYALILQGAAAGVLYVTLFAAARLYHLVPLPLALAFMVALVALTGWLSVLQDARSLAAFGAAGGFLAPVLVSSGGGSHVLLFSYYALLNAGILGIAWFKAWRALNLIGCFFTFAIGAAWGHDQYRAADFASTEPFLILFFLFYVAISVLFAHRQPVRLRGYVDGTLTFGVPIVVFALQARLVRGMDWGLAYSALAMGGFYIVLAALLWRRAVTGMRLLTEAFLALGVVFVSLAAPLALDGRWTAAAWAMEGAALVWIGVRQNRTAARGFGLLLQIGAGAAFLQAMGRPPGDIPVLNGACLGSLLISLSGLFSAWFLARHEEGLRRWELRCHLPMLFWGLAWWFGGGFNEISRHLLWQNERWASLVFSAVSFAGMGAAYRRLDWAAMRYPSLLWVPALWLAAASRWSGSPAVHLFSDGFGLPWLLAAGVHFFLLFRFEALWPKGLLRAWHLLGFFFVVFTASWESAWAVHRMVGGGRVWWTAMWGVTPGAVLWVMSRPWARLSWPVQRFAGVYLSAGPWGLALLLFLWTLQAAFIAGDPAPLFYLPVVNPLVLSQAFALVTILAWTRHAQRTREIAFPSPAREWVGAVPAIHGALTVGAFVCLNGMVARAVHFFGGVPFNAAALYRSMLFQAAAAILWTLASLGAMAVGARKAFRPVWFAGAGLLGMVVIKLFLVDLGGSGTVARIVSFIAVGVLMLLIGYLSPLPPRKGGAPGDRPEPLSKGSL